MSPPSATRPSQVGHATHPALHLRDARDAHIVFEAVRLNILPLITRRLAANEREALTSGNVFVWEEAEHKQGGLERWTDGRRWSQSRMRGDYLYYEEKIETTSEEKEAKAARRARRTLDPFAYQPTPTRRQDRPSKPDGLTKQTYSTHVRVHPSEPPRKWHIVAYFSGDDYACLPVVENYEYLRNLRIPEGIYASTKGNLTRISTVMNAGEGHEDSQLNTNHSDWGPAPWSLPSPSGTDSRTSDRPLSSCSSSSTSTILHSSRPYAVSRRPSTPSTPSTLPRLATLIPANTIPAHTQTSVSSSGPSHTSYSPLTPEDRRALNSFRVIL
ncbi:hypothetical protein CERSUDRAFT_68437 [Gelatoporia subvermispora B]|uniref:cAMP-independent regulatory protein pac2 n=1 Tax=Ceriporiopsis subvermispora (strain B) TaxID=914234 RepID=M2R1D5_CERS8|nr:hypothetical protein CERSUDRAFT_68437 [Gelatoporia subvermispora B]